MLSVVWTKPGCAAAVASLEQLVIATKEDECARNETFSAHGPALVSIIAQSVQRLCASSSDAAYADSGLEQAATDLDALRVLTECVRLVRNTAAAGPHAQLGLSGIVPHLSTFLSSTAMLVEGGAAWSAAIAVAKRSVLQSLVNLSSGCEENKRSVWSSCFPNVITTCLTVGLTSADRSMLAVCSALIHTLTVSCEGDTSPNVRLLQLASHGSTLELLYRSVIVPSSSSSESDATTSSCLEGSDDPVLSWAAFITDSLLNSALLHTALASLRSPDPECVATSEQLVCVRLAGHCLGVDEESGLVSPESSPLTPFSPRILIDIVHTYCALSARRSRTPTAHACAHCGGSESPQKVCSRCKATRYCSPACQAAHWPVHKALCVPPPPTPALSPAATVFLRLLWESKACLLTILSCGAVVITGDSSLLNLELESELAGPFIRLLHADATACEKPALQAVMPFGFKAACMRLLANASAHASTVLKDAVLASGALTLVLNSCKVDPQQPMQREWALLAIRHLCDGHAPTQAFIAQLKAIAVVDSPELAALGVKATVNEDGKVDIQKPDGGAGTK